MTRHQKPFDYFTLENVSLHQFRHIGFRADPIPRAFGIDDHAGSIFTMIQAAGLIGPNRTFDTQPLDLFFKEGMQTFGSAFSTASARVPLGPLINADKNMVSEGRHESTLDVRRG